MVSVSFVTPVPVKLPVPPVTEGVAVMLPANILSIQNSFLSASIVTVGLGSTVTFDVVVF